MVNESLDNMSNIGRSLFRLEPLLGEFADTLADNICFELSLIVRE